MTPTPNELFEKYQPLVGWCYRTYIDAKFFHPWMEDILQEGRLALWQACNNFDESKGCQFTTYAIPFVSGKMRQYSKYKCNVIRLPRKAFEGDDDMLKNLGNVLSLDAPIDEDSSTILGDVISKESDFHEFMTEELVDEFISTITDDVLRDMIEEYFYNKIWGLGIDVTQQELAEKYGISQAQCSRMINMYKNKFKEFLNK